MQPKINLKNFNIKKREKPKGPEKPERLKRRNLMAAPKWPGPSRFRVSNNLGVPQVFSEVPKGLTPQTGHLGSNLLLFCLLRYPHSSATFLVASKKDMNLPILFQVPDILSKVPNYFLMEKKPEAINSSRMTEYEYKGYHISLTQP